MSLWEVVLNGAAGGALAAVIGLCIRLSQRRSR